MTKKSPWLIFTLVAIAQFMVVLDVAITNVALPTIRQELGFSVSSLQWVVTAYALSFGGFLLFGGRTADLFGRRRMLLTGMTAFTLFSLLIGLSASPTELVVLRALQGASAALMSPAALSIVLVTFRDGLERNKALGYWTLVATGGAAIGMLLGGMLTQYFGWRWNFFINVPIGIVMSLLIARYVPAHASEEKRTNLDAIGALLITTSLMTLVFAFSQAPQWGWLAGKTLLTLGGAFVLLAAFVVNELNAKRPLVPMSIFKIRNVSGANLIMAPLYASMMGTFFLTTLYLQGTLHFSPVTAGLSFLPFPVILGLMSTRIPKLVSTYGYRRFLIVGPLIVAASLIWLSNIHANGNYFVDILPTLILMPLGIGFTMMPTIAAATSGVPAHEAGLASGLVSTSQQMGGALGLAILSGIAASVTVANLHLGTTAATIQGYHVAFLADVVFMLVAVTVAALVVQQPKVATRSTKLRLQPVSE